jgi:hypothetical protein
MTVAMLPRAVQNDNKMSTNFMMLASVSGNTVEAICGSVVTRREEKQKRGVESHFDQEIRAGR